MTRDELRAGLVRLGQVVAVTVGLIVLAGVALWALGGGGLGSALALAFSLASALLVLGGAAVGLQTGSMSMDRDRGERRARYRSKREVREHELLAIGLIAAGVASFVVALIVG
jgi:hypothetical protein